MKKLFLLFLTLIPISGMDIELKVTVGLPEDQIVKYRLYVQRGTNEFVEVMTVSTNTLMTVTHVIPDTYKFYVRSENTNGILSLPSNVLEATVRPSPPRLTSISTTNENGIVIIQDAVLPNTNRVVFVQPGTGRLYNPTLSVFYGDMPRKPVLVPQTNVLNAVGFLPPSAMPLPTPPLPPQ